MTYDPGTGGGGGGGGLSALLIDKTITVSKASTATDTRPGGSSKYDSALPFATIQAAHDAAVPGDTIKIEAGTYTENVSLTAVAESGPPMSIVAHGAVLDGVLAIDGVTGFGDRSVNLYGLRINPTTTAVEAAVTTVNVPTVRCFGVLIDNRNTTIANVIGIKNTTSAVFIGDSGCEVTAGKTGGAVAGYVAAMTYGGSFTAAVFRGFRIVAFSQSTASTAVDIARLTGSTLGPLDFNGCIFETWSLAAGSTHTSAIIRGLAGSSVEVRITACSIRNQEFSATSVKYMPVLLEAGSTCRVVVSGLTHTRTKSAPSEDQIYASGAADAGAYIELSNVVWDSRSTDTFPERYSVGSDLGTIKRVAVNAFASMIVGGELGVGEPSLPAMAGIGGGRCYNEGLRVLRNTNLEAGTWSEITAEVKDAGDASTADLFSTIATNGSLYIGAPQRFSGAHIDFSVDGDNLVAYGSSPTLAVEYWDGAAWQSMPIFSAEAGGARDNYGAGFSNASALGAENVRFGPGWELNTAKTLNSIAGLYWVRFRLLANITTSPAADLVKLFPSTTMFSEDLLEYHGKAKPRAEIPGWSREQMTTMFAILPSDLDINASANVNLDASRNNFSGAAVDGFGTDFVLPDWLDTSEALEVEVYLWQSGLGSGDIVSQLHVVKIDAVNGAQTELVEQLTTAAPGADDSKFSVAHSVNLNDLGQIKPGDQFVASWRRVGTDVGDTAPNAAYYSTRMIGRRWRA